jgi:hypothetical protein
MTQEITVHGTVAEGFEAVREEFAAVVAEERPDYEGKLSAYVNGQRVVNLWAGPDSGADALHGVFSSTKGRRASRRGAPGPGGDAGTGP